MPQTERQKERQGKRPIPMAPMIITRIIEKDPKTGRERVIREEPTMGLRMWRRVVRQRLRERTQRSGR